jgi:exodeoxyribonuclease-3
MPAWIRALIWVSGRDIQRETIQIMLDAGYLDGYRLLHPSERGSTFPVWDPHLRLDYIFLPARYASRLKSCRVIGISDEITGAAAASDHFPLLSEVEIP